MISIVGHIPTAHDPAPQRDALIHIVRARGNGSIGKVIFLVGKAIILIGKVIFLVGKAII
jgi:hypothetical protein